MPARGMPGARGEQSGRAKLTAKKVVRLRERHADGEPVNLLAKEYGIAGTTAGFIVTGRTWVDVGGPIRPVRDHRVSRTTAKHCPVDGFLVEHLVDLHGRAYIKCEACERRKARRCIDCGVPVDGKAWRCPKDKKRQAERAHTDHVKRHRERINERARVAAAARTGENRRRHLEYKKDWRKKNPRKVMLQKRRARLAGKPGGWATREKYEAYHRDYRAKHAKRLRAQSIIRYHQTRPAGAARRCTQCGMKVPYAGHGRPATRCDVHRIGRLAPQEKDRRDGPKANPERRRA